MTAAVIVVEPAFGGLGTVLGGDGPVFGRRHAVVSARRVHRSLVARSVISHLLG